MWIWMCTLFIDVHFVVAGFLEFITVSVSRILKEDMTMDKDPIVSASLVVDWGHASSDVWRTKEEGQLANEHLLK